MIEEDKNSASELSDILKFILRVKTLSRSKIWKRKRYLKGELNRRLEDFYANISSETILAKQEELSEIYLAENKPLMRELDALVTAELIDQANKHGIDILPEWINAPYSESYIYHRNKGTSYVELTVLGTVKLRNAIRQKRRENIEWWMTKIVIPLIAALTGLAGTVIAILALVRK
jgi:hypothetical protein